MRCRYKTTQDRKPAASPNLKERKAQAVARFGISAAMSIICIVLLAFLQASAQEITSPLPPLREQDAIQQEWLKLRLERVLPALMREHKVQMWIVPMREYNEDPVFSSFVSATTFSARRRTIYVFYDRGAQKGIERLALGGT